MESYVLDCQGSACPEPVIRTRKVILELHPETIQVIVDNAAALENVSRLLSNQNYEVYSEKQKDIWNIYGKHLTSTECQIIDQNLLTPPRKTIVLITTETIGQGSDELGLKLMESFLATLPELEDELWRVILLNGGVKLTASPGKCLDSLKNLEKSGVTILVCGACLTFFGLLEAKLVGDTTNMLDVMTSLAMADKVIRP